MFYVENKKYFKNNHNSVLVGFIWAGNTLLLVGWTKSITDLKALKLMVVVLLCLLCAN